jgi:hypothetical protein
MGDSVATGSVVRQEHVKEAAHLMGRKKQKEKEWGGQGNISPPSSPAPVYYFL